MEIDQTDPLRPKRACVGKFLDELVYFSFNFVFFLCVFKKVNENNQHGNSLPCVEKNYLFNMLFEHM